MIAIQTQHPLDLILCYGDAQNGRKAAATKKGGSLCQLLLPKDQLCYPSPVDGQIELSNLQSTALISWPKGRKGGGISAKVKEGRGTDLG